MSDQQLDLKTRSALLELKQALHVMYRDRLQGLYLYGSCARGTAHQDSDVDILIVLEGAVKTGAEISRMNPIISDICLRHDLLISTFPVSTEWRQIHGNPFFENVRKEAVPV